jgi:ribosomal protein L34
MLCFELAMTVAGDYDCKLNWLFLLLNRRAVVENHRISKVKKARKSGFRARMRTSKGRDIINRQRRAGRSVNVEM